MKSLKFLLWGGLALTVLLGGYSTAQAANLASQLDYELHPQFAGLDASGIVLDLDVSYRNDTPGSVQVNHPKVEVYHADSLLAVLDLAGQQVKIRPHSRGRLSDPDMLKRPLRVSIPLKVIEEKAPEAIGSYLGFGPPLELQVWVSGQLVIPWMVPIGFSRQETITLKATG